MSANAKGLSAQQASLVLERNNFRLSQLLSPKKPQADTHWEEITCVGYNPDTTRLEAVVSLKLNAGYNGGLCSVASAEYVRFFVDFKDGAGYRNMGLASFKSADIPNVDAGGDHPLKYMVSINLDDSKYRTSLDCKNAIIPRVRAVLSWNTVPTMDPNQTPHYGNVMEADILINRRNLFNLGSVSKINNSELLNVLKNEATIKAMMVLPNDAKSLYENYAAAKVPHHRLFFSTVGSMIHSNMNFSKATSAFSFESIKNIGADLSGIIKYLNSDQHNADVSFEEVTCVGLNTDTDTLGAVVHIKKSTGYSGDLCHTGSTEHVAFWADWNNDGTFDQYLGTQSFTIHDINNIPAGGLFYNVALPLDVNGKLRDCHSPNIIKVRAVLSWEALPSTTDPNALNTWGNSKDALVQLRPGSSEGLYTIISKVGDVDRMMIDASTYLYNYNAVSPTYSNNRPWGGLVNFKGIIDRNGFAGVVKYRLRFKTQGALDSTYASVAHAETNSLWNPFISIYPYSNPQTADADGWFIYQPDPAHHVFSNDDNHLANWNTNALTGGAYTIRFEYTDPFGNPVTGDEFTIMINNEGMSVSPTANTVVDAGYDLDLVIDGGDCHSYTNNDSVIHGHVKAVHPYFALWAIELQPTSHTHGVLPSPTERDFSLAHPNGDGNFPWTLDTKNLDPCGYTVSLHANSRVILNSNPGNFPYYGPKAVGFAKLP